MGEKRLYRTHLTRELADERRVRAAIDVRARLDDVDGMTRDRVRDAGGEPGDDLLRRGEAARFRFRRGGGHDARRRGRRRAPDALSALSERSLARPFAFVALALASASTPSWSQSFRG